MSRLQHKKQRGFSLIEQMAVVAIIAILAAIIYPSYQRSIEKSRRVEAKGNLSIIAQGLERCFTQFGVYNNANCVLAPVTWRHYTFTPAPTITATTYSLTATTTDSQINDGPCATFTLTNTGARTATGTDFTKCW